MLHTLVRTGQLEPHSEFVAVLADHRGTNRVTHGEVHLDRAWNGLIPGPLDLGPAGRCISHRRLNSCSILQFTDHRFGGQKPLCQARPAPVSTRQNRQHQRPGIERREEKGRRPIVRIGD